MSFSTSQDRSWLINLAPRIKQLSCFPVTFAQLGLFEYILLLQCIPSGTLGQPELIQTAADNQ